MKPEPKSVAVIADWPGLYTNSGPSNGGRPAGTAEIQENLQSTRPGELATRPGLQPVRFDDEE
jgi:hypothetical protein